MSSTAVPKGTPADQVAAASMRVPTTRQMLALWLPLAATIVMMVLEPTIINMGLGRTTDAELALAAYGVAFSLALVVEAPVLMLIDASVARSTHRAAFALLERFALAIGLGMTAFGLIVSATPLYGLIVERLMDIPAAVAAHARPTLVILSFWPLPIGWRRTQQGLLIRAHRTVVISLATMVRLATLAAGIAGGLLAWPSKGAIVAGVAMDLSVIAEALVVTVAARGALGSRALPDTGAPLTLRDLWRFYVPLATTSVIQQVARPVLNAGIAAAALGYESLAAWPVVWALVTLIAGPAWSLQQFSNALGAEGDAYRRVRNFALTLCLLFSVVVGLMAIRPVYAAIMGGVYNLSPELQALAWPATVLMIPFPLLLGTQAFLRGILIRRANTPAVRAAVVVNVVTALIAIVAGTRLMSATGVVLAAVVTQVALLAEVAWLRWRARSDIPESRLGERKLAD